MRPAVTRASRTVRRAGRRPDAMAGLDLSLLRYELTWAPRTCLGRAVQWIRDATSQLLAVPGRGPVAGRAARGRLVRGTSTARPAAGWEPFTRARGGGGVPT